MNIHEYQGKAAAEALGAPVADGVAVFKASEAEAAAKKLPGPLYVVKSQIHAGGRGKGKFKELAPDAKGGVRLAKSVDDVVANVNEMLGKTLVTKQTGPAGKQVNRLYIEDGADIERELYLSILVDRSVGRIAFVVSTEGGMDIEAVAHDTPEKIVTVAIDPEKGVTSTDVKKLNAALKLDGDAAKDGETLFPLLYNAFVEKDMSLLEINPLIVMKDGHLRVLDAKVSFDNNALFRHPEHRRTARHDRRGREGDRGVEIRPRLCRARRQYRLHGQRRRPRHGDDGHHQALRRRAGQLPRRRRRRFEGKGHGGVQDHHRRPGGEGHPGQHLRRHHEMRRHRRRRDRRGEGSRAEGAAGGPARRHQRRARQEDHQRERPERDLGRRSRRRGQEDRRGGEGAEACLPRKINLVAVGRLRRSPTSSIRMSPATSTICQAKVAKFGAVFDWHAHENEDEAFLVLRGKIAIDFRDGPVELGEGDFIVVPRTSSTDRAR